MAEIKQVIVIRKDLGLGTGKAVSQGAHASIMGYLAVLKKDESIAHAWITGDEKKIVLKVENLDDLKKLHEKFKKKGIPIGLVKDAGKTQVSSGTITALGIGPWYSKDINPITSKLKLL